MNMAWDIGIGYGNRQYLCAKEYFCEKICHCQAKQLDMTLPPYAIRGGAGGLVLHRPREEKNDHNSTTGSSENNRKSRNKPIT